MTEGGKSLCTTCREREAEPGEDQCEKCRYKNIQAREQYRDR